VLAYVLTGVAGVLTAAWLPIAFRFLRRWKYHRHPVGLAICLLILLVAYFNWIVISLLLQLVEPNMARVGAMVVEGVVVLVFYLSFWWGDKRFPDFPEQAPNGEH
jgi:O-antigen/teichoic acid export membrane protein